MQPTISTIVDGRYEILSQLGEGGMGTVYKARELVLNRLVAIKFLQPSLLQSPEIKARFEREAEICSSLNHEHVCSFFRFGVWQNQSPYIVMEYVSGKSLRELLNEESRLPWRRAAQIVASIADAMDYVHNSDIIHRDIKPSNFILLTEPYEDFVKVMDFGLGRVTRNHTESQKYTQTGELIGTVLYMSPEQCQGKPADKRSDIYALGCVLFECITGEPPFTADTPVGLLHMHANSPIPALRTAENPGKLPEGLEEIVHNALAKSADDRYQSMSEFKEDLLLLLADKRPQRRAPQNTAKGMRKKLIVCTALAVLGSGLLFWSNLARLIPSLVEAKVLSSVSAEQFAQRLVDKYPLKAAEILQRLSEAEPGRQTDCLRIVRLKAGAATAYFRSGLKEEASALIVAATNLLASTRARACADDKATAKVLFASLAEIAPKERSRFNQTVRNLIQRYSNNFELEEAGLKAQLAMELTSNNSYGAALTMTSLAKLYETKIPQEARKWLAKAEKTHRPRQNNEQDLHRLIGKVYLALGEPSEAARFLGLSIITCKLRAAEHMIEQKKFAEAKTLLNGATPKTTIDRDFALHVWAKYYLGTGETNKAEQILNSLMDKLQMESPPSMAVPISLLYLDFYNGCGSIARSQKLLRKALALLEKSQPLSASQAIALSNTYVSLAELHNAEKAIVPTLEEWLSEPILGVNYDQLLAVDKYLEVLQRRGRIGQSDTLVLRLLSRYQKTSESHPNPQFNKEFLKVLARRSPMSGDDRLIPLLRADLTQWATPEDVNFEAISALGKYAQSANQQAMFNEVLNKALALANMVAIAQLEQGKVAPTYLFAAYENNKRLSELETILRSNTNSWSTTGRVSVPVMRTYLLCLGLKRREKLTPEQSRFLDLATSTASSDQSLPLWEVVSVNSLYGRDRQAKELLMNATKFWCRPENVDAPLLTWYLDHSLDKCEQLESTQMFQDALMNENPQVKESIIWYYLRCSKPDKAVAISLPIIDSWRTPEDVRPWTLNMFLRGLQQSKKLKTFDRLVRTSTNLAQRQLQASGNTWGYICLADSFLILNQPERGMQLIGTKIESWQKPEDVNLALLEQYNKCRRRTSQAFRKANSMVKALTLASKSLNEKSTKVEAAELSRAFHLCGLPERALCVGSEQLKN